MLSINELKSKAIGQSPFPVFGFLYQPKQVNFVVYVVVFIKIHISQVPSWLKSELESGIPVDASADASGEDSSDEEDEDDLSADKVVPKSTVKRENSQLTDRAPYTRRISNQSLLRNREFRYRVSTGQLASVADMPKKETTIIDGIAISSSNDNSLISNVVTSSACASRSSSVTEIDMNSPVHVTADQVWLLFEFCLLLAYGRKSFEYHTRPVYLLFSEYSIFFLSPVPFMLIL